MSEYNEVQKLSVIIASQEKRIRDLHDSSNIKFLEDLYLQLRKSQEEVVTLNRQLESCKKEVTYQNKKIKELDSLYQNVYLYWYDEKTPDGLRDKAEAIEELNNFRSAYVK